MHEVLSDLKLVFRQLRKSPGLTATAVLTLAFGIGVTTAIFSIVDGVLLRPLPFPNASRLVTLGDQVSGTDWGHQIPDPLPRPEVVTYQRDTRSFQSLGGYQPEGYELSGVGEPAQIDGVRMTPSVFSVRHRAAYGPHLHPGGRSAKGTGRGAQLWRLEEPLQRQPAYPRHKDSA